MRSFVLQCRPAVKRSSLAVIAVSCAMTACKPEAKTLKAAAVKPPMVAASREPQTVRPSSTAWEPRIPPKLPDLAIGSVHSVLFTPDGRRLVFDTGAGVAAIDLTRGRLLWYTEAVSFTELLLMTADGRRIVTTTTDPDKDTPTLIITIGGRVTARLPDVGPDSGGVVSLDLVGHYLIRRAFTWKSAASDDRTVTDVWNIQTGRQTDRRTSRIIDESGMPLWQYIEQWRVTGHPTPSISQRGKLVDNPLRAANNPLSMAGKYPAAAWWSKTAGPRQGDRFTMRSGRYFICLRDYMAKIPCVEVWDLLKKKRLWRAVYVNSAPLTAAVSPDGHTLAVAGTEHAVRFFDIKTGRTLAKTQYNMDILRTAAYSPNGRILAVAGGDVFEGRDGVILLDAKTYRPVATIKVARNTFTPESDGNPWWDIQTADGSYTASSNLLSYIAASSQLNDGQFLYNLHNPHRVRETLRPCWSESQPMVAQHR